MGKCRSQSQCVGARPRTQKWDRKTGASTICITRKSYANRDQATSKIGVSAKSLIGIDSCGNQIHWKTLGDQSMKLAIVQAALHRRNSARAEITPGGRHQSEGVDRVTASVACRLCQWTALKIGQERRRSSWHGNLGILGIAVVPWVPASVILNGTAHQLERIARRRVVRRPQKSGRALYARETRKLRSCFYIVVVIIIGTLLFCRIRIGNSEAVLI